jgi:hypothetical protein
MTFTQVPAPPNGARPRSALDQVRWRQLAAARVRLAAGRTRSRAASAWSRARRWKWAPAWPAVAGIILVSMAVAGLVAWAVAWPPGLWAGLLVLGGFLLRIDSRLS